ncbi:hypothetical protein ACIBG8_12720 [Nonomuraea sp. NPDC050556]|uniref:hypothetical protein n=1 Tax=Nonomuraea sp. NPDC050556 TaxID=3364369 RepID=UPI0037A1D222
MSTARARLPAAVPGDPAAVRLQQFVYRQLMYLVVIQSVATALLGVRLPWQTIRREGTFASP